MSTMTTEPLTPLGTVFDPSTYNNWLGQQVNFNSTKQTECTFVPRYNNWECDIPPQPFHVADVAYVAQVVVTPPIYITPTSAIPEPANAVMALMVVYIALILMMGKKRRAKLEYTKRTSSSDKL